MNPYKLFLPVLTLALVTVNLLAFGYFGDYVSRIVRFVSMFLLFIVFMTPKFYKTNGLIIFSLYVINDLLLINFESLFVQNVVLFIRLIAYFLLANLLRPYLKGIRIRKVQGAVFIIVLIINLLLLQFVNEIIAEDRPTSFLVDLLFYGYGASVIVAVTLAFTFYNRYTEKASIFFLLAILFLILSDMTYFFGFYLDFPEFYYLDRALNLVGIGFLLHFFFLFKKNFENGNVLKSKNLI